MRGAAHRQDVDKDRRSGFGRRYRDGLHGRGRDAWQGQGGNRRDRFRNRRDRQRERYENGGMPNDGGEHQNQPPRPAPTDSPTP